MLSVLTQRGAQRQACAVPRLHEPCRPALREEAPSGARWVHEIKFDGYRSRIASPEGKVFDGAGRLVAHGSETCLISTVRSGTAGVP